MTVVAGIKTSDGVMLGADTGMTGDFGRKGSGISVVCQMDINKLTSLTLDGGEELIWGAAGSWYAIQSLQLHWQPGTPMENTHGYLVNIVHEAIKILYEHAGDRRAAVEDEDYEGAAAFEMIIGFRGDLWAVSGEGCVDRVADDYVAVGSASLVTYGALYATQGSDMRPADRLTMSLDAAVYTNTEIRAPYTFATAGHATEKKGK